ncbi:MAG: hypothetical protein D6712_07745, partial [Chloroflexi bacterium]
LEGDNFIVELHFSGETNLVNVHLSLVSSPTELIKLALHNLTLDDLKLLMLYAGLPTGKVLNVKGFSVKKGNHSLGVHKFEAKFVITLAL